MTRTTTAVVAALALTTLAACGDDAGSTSDATSPTDTTTDADDPNAELRDLYNEALDGLNLDNDRFTDEDNAAPLYDSTGEFEYSLVDIDGDDTPEMLVAAIGDPFKISKVFAVADGSLIETDQLFADGAATGGGSRAGFHTSAEHNGVFKTLGRSGNGQYVTSRWSLEGDQMVEGQTWEYRIDQIPSDLDAEQAEIQWTSTDDRSALDHIGEADDADGADDQGDGPNPDLPGATSDSGDSSGSATSGGSLPQTDTASPDQTGTECGTVDGVTVTAGSATSCGFAMNVAQQALHPGSWEPGVAPDATVTPPWGQTTVTASSPATGQTYTLSCNSGTDPFYANCSGGNNARIQFNKTAQGGLMYLLG
ncbi:hypothetical protein [Corynebacterium sp. AOP40-4SA-5]|uniref:hypothetical protein n=1 Tax=Corynebacterium sp. AOP40-4SA-5 TaxID=3457678 RepID=UPI00264EE272|nr:hypothetical protein [Corynebacterium sp.]